MYTLYCSQFNTEFLQWMSIHYGSTYHNCHTELLCDPLGQHHCKDHNQLYSLYNAKLCHQIQFLRVRCHQGLSMKRGSVFRIPHIQGVYPMPYSIWIGLTKTESMMTKNELNVTKIAKSCTARVLIILSSYGVWPILATKFWFTYWP